MVTEIMHEAEYPERMILIFDKTKDMQHFLNFMNQEIIRRRFVRDGMFVTLIPEDCLPCEIDCQHSRISFWLKEESTFLFWDIIFKYKKLFPNIKFLNGQYS